MLMLLIINHATPPHLVRPAGGVAALCITLTLLYGTSWPLLAWLALLHTTVRRCSVEIECRGHDGLPETLLPKDRTPSKHHML